jgi:hypothetical protein
MMPESAVIFRPIWKIRIIAIITSIVVLLWLPVEDDHEWTVLILAVAISGLIGIRFLLGTYVNKKRFLHIYAITGLFTGLVISPITIGLMAFKTGLHGHDVPDFTPDQIQTVLWLAPFFGGSGLFVGLGSGFLRKLLDKDATQS